jgi:hypothetical protein
MRELTCTYTVEISFDGKPCSDEDLGTHGLNGKRINELYAKAVEAYHLAYIGEPRELVLVGRGEDYEPYWVREPFGDEKALVGPFEWAVEEKA